MADEVSIKHEVNPSALIIIIEKAHQVLYFMYSKSKRCFNWFKELTHKRLVKAYLF